MTTFARTTALAARIPLYIERATSAFEAGFATKSAQKDALDSLNRAFDAFRDLFFEDVRAVAPHQHALGELNEQQSRERWDHFEAHDLPFSLHQVRDRHIGIIAGFKGEGEATTVRDLIALRAAIKSAAIIPVERKEDAAVVAVRAQIEDLIALRKAQYGRALELGELFGGLPVSTNWHYVQNQYGTVFPRCFFYLAGKLTPLNVLVAASQELERRKAG
jgi:hypothetical protein